MLLYTVQIAKFARHSPKLTLSVSFARPALYQNKLHWFVAKKEDSENTYAGLAHLATAHDIDLLIVGNIGRTQSKTESAERYRLSWGGGGGGGPSILLHHPMIL